MTKEKDLKRIVRNRMQKTSESYTAARAHVVKSTRIPKSVAPKNEWAALAGVSDEAVKEKTGRKWHQWVSELDDVNAFEKSHRDIARHLNTTYDEVSPWWAQTLTVGYERIRGMRDVGQDCTGTFVANKTRTLGVDVSTLFRTINDARKRKAWMPGVVVKVRTAIEDTSIRLDWHDGTQVNFYFVDKGPQKSSITVQHQKLANKSEIDVAKAFWQERFDALKALLA